VKEFLLSMFKNPRICLAYYSSIMAKNLIPVMIELLQGELEPLRLNEEFRFFDQTYCPLMKDHKYLKDILDEPYDRYRDLNSVWNCEMFEENGLKFDHTNTLLIDSDDKKVQLWLENSMVTEPFRLIDVQLGEGANDSEWQENYMNKITSFITDMAESG